MYEQATDQQQKKHTVTLQMNMLEQANTIQQQKKHAVALQMNMLHHKMKEAKDSNIFKARGFKITAQIQEKYLKA